MISRDEALARVQSHLEAMTTDEARHSFGGYVVTQELERDRLWVFHYHSRNYMENPCLENQLGGGGPILVEKESGLLHQLNSANAGEEGIAAFERERFLIEVLLEHSGSVVLPPRVAQRLEAVFQGDDCTYAHRLLTGFSIEFSRLHGREPWERLYLAMLKHTDLEALRGAVRKALANWKELVPFAP